LAVLYIYKSPGCAAFFEISVDVVVGWMGADKLIGVWKYKYGEENRIFQKYV